MLASQRLRPFQPYNISNALNLVPFVSVGINKEKDMSKIVGVKCCLLGALTALSATGHGAEVTWSGVADHNWNTPRNWSSQKVPGTQPGDQVVLSGRNVRPVVATPVEVSNACSIRVSDEALLEVCEAELRCAEVLLGADAGKAGGHLELRGRPPIKLTVSGNLCVGNTLAATSDSSLKLKNGSLTVAGALQLGKGYGEEPKLVAKDLAVSAHATLRFDFGINPVCKIKVLDRLAIAKGAKLEIDLRNYSSGSNELELISFGSVSGAFDPQNITITGLGGGIVTMDEDSLNLTVIDGVAARSSTLWFVSTGGDGTDDLDLQINTGRRIRNLSSPDLSYSSVADGDDRIYSVRWSGSDFDGDGGNDDVSFDLRVEAFTGSTCKLAKAKDKKSKDSKGSNLRGASMTALGKSALVAGNSAGWGVGNGRGLDAGETLRFSIENLRLSTPGVGDGGSFVGMRMVEPNGGKGHTLIVGEGKNLESWTWSNVLNIGFAPEYPLLVTSAKNSKVGVNQVAFKLVVSDLPDYLDTETGDYSIYPMGPQHLSEYPAVTDRKFPRFTWDTLQMSADVRSRKPLSDFYAKVMAMTYPKLGLGGNSSYGCNNKDEGIRKTAAQLKAINPDVVLTTYRNSGVHFGGFPQDKDLNEKDWFTYSIGEDGKRKYEKHSGGQLGYNHDHPDLRKWWVDVAVSLLEDPNIDGVFVDKANGGDQPVRNDAGELEAMEGRVQTYIDLKQRAPAGSFVTGNILRTSRSGGNRELLHIFNGAYLESWHIPNGQSLIALNQADTVCASIQLMREARVKGFDVQTNFKELKWHKMKSKDESVEKMVAAGREEEVRQGMIEAMQYPLAFFLITAEPYSYFNYQTESDPEMPEFCWNPKGHFDEFRNPLGKPLGPPVQKGYIYTRSFEHVDVWLDVENQQSRLTWDWQPIADAQSVTVAKNTPKSITVTGSDPRKTDLTFKVLKFGQPANGKLSGQAPNLIYTPNPGFTGKDSFSFKSYNDMAESLLATVTVTVVSEK
jgi:hypothetical protein